ncbi:hypothetical protein E3N88_24512 [Mikania micrantha]|uniref:Uncharacterized protein n=1 Tax=Mikania micrantha TaxID=192012 RepID=A0A5N6N2E0_9ASTR|nr:hypothetical protein E3N88_24512 [Mikania micrantha]
MVSNVDAGPAMCVMVTHEFSEGNLQTENLYRVPIIKPALGTPRCPSCISPLKSNSLHFQLSNKWQVCHARHRNAGPKGTVGMVRCSLSRPKRWGFNLGGAPNGDYAVHIRNIIYLVACQRTKVASVCHWDTSSNVYNLFPSVPPLLMSAAANAAYGGMP